jgi:hypothetical protein
MNLWLHKVNTLCVAFLKFDFVVIIGLIKRLLHNLYLNIKIKINIITITINNAQTITNI